MAKNYTLIAYEILFSYPDDVDKEPIDCTSAIACATCSQYSTTQPKGYCHICYSYFCDEHCLTCRR